MARRRRNKTSKRRGSRQSRRGNGTLFQHNGVHSLAMGPIYKFIRNGTPGTLVKSPSDIGYGIDFKLSNVIGVADFTTLFDHYRIDKVEYNIEITTPNLSGIPYPRVVFAADWNDSVAPLSESEVLEKRTARVFQFSPTDTVATFTVVPRVADTLYNTSLTSGYGLSAPHWVDTGYPAVPHFGMKFWVADYNSVTSTLPVLRAYSRFYLSMRASR